MTRRSITASGNSITVLRRLFIAAAIILIPAAVSISAGRVPETIIKVAIKKSGSPVHIKCGAAVKAVDLEDFGSIKLKGNKDHIIEARGAGLEIGGKRMSGSVRFVPQNIKEFIRVDGRRYRDTIVVVNRNGELTVVNELGVDGYLFGVLPVEVSPKWPIEALKAQAVVSRTYVMNNLGKYSKDGYDLSSDIFSQVYRGVEVENPATNRAVKDTRGMVLTYKGELAKAYFHSSCGGHTADIEQVWGNPIEYMRGVVCPYCKDSPRYKWESSMDPETLRRKLNAGGYPTGKILDIEFLSRTRTGRIKQMYVIHSKGKLLMTGHRFRMAVGPDIIKGTLMTLDRNKPQFSFYGRGWGHGVGMCQWGAKGLAERGAGFRKILRYYFPGTRVTKWDY